MQYKVEVLTVGETQFAGNALRFDTYAEADHYAQDLFSRWTAVKEYRIVEVPTEQPIFHAG